MVYLFEHLAIRRCQTSGDLPPQLTGAATVVVGDKLYLFGGESARQRQRDFFPDLYVLDFPTQAWEKVVPKSPPSEGPQGRQFHSLVHWDNHLISFGGTARHFPVVPPAFSHVAPDQPQPSSHLRPSTVYFNDLWFFSLQTLCWYTPVSPPQISQAFIPKARYGHLSCISADRLFVIGGQIDIQGGWIHDICVYDLIAKAWVQRRLCEGDLGTHRSVAVVQDVVVRYPLRERVGVRRDRKATAQGMLFEALEGEEAREEDDWHGTPTESLIHLPYSAPPTEDFPGDIQLYSTPNFKEPARIMQTLSPLPDTDFTIQDRSSELTLDITGRPIPPLRFPSGDIVGSHLILSGTRLSSESNSLCMCVMDLNTLQWSRVPLGKMVETGAWFKGCVWLPTKSSSPPEQTSLAQAFSSFGAQYIIFGTPTGAFLADYNRRLNTFTHFLSLDLESVGIYRPPPLLLPIPSQLSGLSALEQGIFGDFEVICEDGMKVVCSRRILEERWSWFKRRMDNWRMMVGSAMWEMGLHGMVSKEKDAEMPKVATIHATSGSSVTVPHHQHPYPPTDPRLTPRSIRISEPYPVALAFVQYLYTQSLITPLQHTHKVMKQLLVLSKVYEMEHLEDLVVHSMHLSLSGNLGLEKMGGKDEGGSSGRDPSSVGIYEVATVCGRRGLQLRALRTVMALAERTQSQSSDPPDQSQQQAPINRERSQGSVSTTSSSSTPQTGPSSASTYTTPTSSIAGTPGGDEFTLSLPPLGRRHYLTPSGTAGIGIGALNGPAGLRSRSRSTSPADGVSGPSQQQLSRGHQQQQQQQQPPKIITVRVQREGIASVAGPRREYQSQYRETTYGGESSARSVLSLAETYQERRVGQQQQERNRNHMSMQQGHVHPMDQMRARRSVYAGGGGARNSTNGAKGGSTALALEVNYNNLVPPLPTHISSDSDTTPTAPAPPSPLAFRSRYINQQQNSDNMPNQTSTGTQDSTTAPQDTSASVGNSNEEFRDGVNDALSSSSNSASAGTQTRMGLISKVAGGRPQLKVPPMPLTAAPVPNGRGGWEERK